MINIGNDIKKTRHKLGITQKDLAGTYMSRNNLSEIENGNVILTAKNALHLFQQLLYFSVLRKYELPIVFDEILEKSEYKDEYNNTKKSMEYHKALLEIKDCALEDIEYNQINRLYQKINHNMLRAVLYTSLGEFLEISANKKEALSAYLKAFDAIRTENETAMLPSLFDKIAPLMFHLALYEEFTSLAIAYIYELKAKKIKIESKIYFNMCIAYSNNAQLTEALDSIEQYLAYDYSYINFSEGLLLKANIYSSLKKREIAKDLYMQSSALFLEKGDYNNYFLTLSNIIDLLVSQGIEAVNNEIKATIIDSIDYYIHDLKQKLTQRYVESINLAKILTNIAKGLAFLGRYEEAISLFETIFEIDLENEKFTHYFRAIRISIPTYVALGRIKELYHTHVKLADLPIIKWSKQLKKIYEEVLLKIGVEIVDSKDEVIKDIFNTLIAIKDYEE